MKFEEAKALFEKFSSHVKRAWDLPTHKPLRLWNVASSLAFMSDHFVFEHEMIKLTFNGVEIIVMDIPLQVRIGIYNFTWV